VVASGCECVQIAGVHRTAAGPYTCHCRRCRNLRVRGAVRGRDRVRDIVDADAGPVVGLDVAFEAIASSRICTRRSGEEACFPASWLILPMLPCTRAIRACACRSSASGRCRETRRPSMTFTPVARWSRSSRSGVVHQQSEGRTAPGSSRHTIGWDWRRSARARYPGSLALPRCPTAGSSRGTRCRGCRTLHSRTSAAGLAAERGRIGRGADVTLLNTCRLSPCVMTAAMKCRLFAINASRWRP